MPRPPAQTPAPRPEIAAPGSKQRVWVLRGGEAVPVPVEIGVTDGRLTEITGGELQAGMEVITERASTGR
jgi:HlyD family secretion protein